MIDKEDYEEPRCPLCNPNEVKPVSMERVTEKLDFYLNLKDYESAKKLLFFWIGEAKVSKDYRSNLALINEGIGISRKLGEEEKATEFIKSALTLTERDELKGTVAVGTTYINIATSFCAFNKYDEAVKYYEKAEEIYLKTLNGNDGRLSALYNNYGTALTRLKNFELAEKSFFKALSLFEKSENGETERAITYCNLADMTEDKLGYEKGKDVIESYLNKAYKLLSDCKNKDFNFAYACEKCAPAFGYYGRVDVEEKLNAVAKEIYERA